jgi:CcmD family protein
MGDLMYAAIVIVIIWAGIFFYLVSLDRRVRNLEGKGSGAAGDGAGSRVVSSPGNSPAADMPEAPAAEAETTGDEAAIE